MVEQHEVVLRRPREGAYEVSVSKRGIVGPGRKELKGAKRMFSGDLLDRVVGGRGVREEARSPVMDPM